MKKLPIILLSTAAMLITFGCGGKKKETENVNGEIDTVSVTIINAEAKDFTEIGNYYGKVTAFNKATLISYTGGQVKGISVKEGSWVNKGKSLAKIDPEKASVQLEMAKAAEQLAKETFDRAAKQLEKENISKVEHDKAKLDWITAKQYLVDARKAWRGSYCVTPINGIVTSRFLELNDEVAPGTPTFNVSQIHKLKVKIGIPESEIGGVKEGNKAVVTMDLYPGQRWEGEISRLAKEIGDNGRNFAAEIVIDNKDKILKPGLTAKIKINRGTIKGKVIVPSELILTESTHNYVMIAKNGVAAYRKVELGSADETQTVLASGVEIGEKLIYKGNNLVNDNTPIRITGQD